MNKTKLPFLLSLSCFILTFTLSSNICAKEKRKQRGQLTKKYAILVSAQVQDKPPQIKLIWPKVNDCLSYIIYRRFFGEKLWKPAPFAILKGDASGYTDKKVQVGKLYEYRIDKIAKRYVGRSYICSGIKVPYVENRGIVLLLVESSIAKPLATELKRLELDLKGDGWTVIRREAGKDDKVADVKKLIVAEYKKSDGKLKTVFLFGHIPVPYSGDIFPDGHKNHRGAWPADIFYADVDGEWTDKKTHKFFPRANQENIPGDGKYDKSVIAPNSLELEVGRVDLIDMPTFVIGEVELLRRYLNKDHFFRHGMMPTKQAGLIDDNFGSFRGEAFGGSAWSNFSTFFGADNCIMADWFTELPKDSYLWAYGCGGGNNKGAGGVGTTRDFHENGSKAVFTMLFGSYFGDWDMPDNFLRAPLAAESHGLTCVWDGRPHWYFHHMGMGKNIGYSALRTQANSSHSDYLEFDNVRATKSGKRDDSEWDYNPVHVALLGDPTLRMHPIVPVRNLTSTLQADGKLKLSWKPSTVKDPHYLVYRADSIDGKFQKLTEKPIAANEFVDNAWPKTKVVYMVKVLALEKSSGGTYENTSQGQFLEVSKQGKSAPQAVLKASSAKTSEDSPVDIPVTLPAKHRCAIVEKPGHGSAKYDEKKRCIVYTPGKHYNGKDAFSIIATDGLRETEPVVVSVDVSPVEDIPVAVSEEFQLSSGAKEQITLKANDPDGDKVTFRIIKAPKVGKLSGTPPNMTYSFKQFPANKQTIEFVVNDGKADSKPGKVTLSVPFKCSITDKPKVIDGKLSDWKNLQFKNLKPPMIKHLDRKKWGGIKDCYFEFDVACDKDYVYIAIKVIDDEVIAKKGLPPWDQDGIELRIDAREAQLRIKGKGKKEFKEIMLYGISPGKSASDQWIYPKSLKQLPKGSKYVCVQTKDGYIAEFAVPISYFNDKAKGHWDGFRLNICIDDKDSDSTNQIWWKPDWRTRKNIKGSGAFYRPRDI